MREFKKSRKLEGVCYDIRGPVLAEAKRLEEEGSRIIKLNIGNPAPFGFTTPDEIIHDMIINIPNAQGYSDSKGLFSARKAVMQYAQVKRIEGVTIEDIYLGNGVSELIMISMQGLLDSGDEILIPAPDYPLWTAAATLAGGKAVHYLCDEGSSWYPDLKDMESKITPNTKGIVVINPNNPTGSVYPLEILEGIVGLARKYEPSFRRRDLRQDTVRRGKARIHRLPRQGCDVRHLQRDIEGLPRGRLQGGVDDLKRKEKRGRRLPRGARYARQYEALRERACPVHDSDRPRGYQSIDDLVAPGGRLKEQRDLCYELLNKIPGVSCVKAKGALYMFPRLDTERFGIRDDEQFVMDLLKEKKLLLVQGTGFNWFKPDHFRVVFLPVKDDLIDAMTRLGDFLSSYRQS
jgi:alanine-synthesizing transaminase